TPGRGRAASPRPFLFHAPGVVLIPFVPSPLAGEAPLVPSPLAGEGSRGRRRGWPRGPVRPNLNRPPRGGGAEDSGRSVPAPPGAGGERAGTTGEGLAA